MPDVQFLVINVASVATPWVAGVGYGVVTPLMVDPRWLESSPEEHADDERALMEESVAAGVPDPVVEVRAGDPVSQICTAAADRHVDVIVVGSHDKSTLRRLFDPSIASGVVRETSLPVLVVSGDEPTLS